MYRQRILLIAILITTFLVLVSAVVNEGKPTRLETRSPDMPHVQNAVVTASTAPVLQARQAKPSAQELGSISGHVIRASTAEPLRGMEVTLTSKDGFQATGTDSNGRFRFAGLAHGQYAIQVAASGDWIAIGDANVTLSAETPSHDAIIVMHLPLRGTIAGQVFDTARRLSAKEWVDLLLKSYEDQDAAAPDTPKIPLADIPIVLRGNGQNTESLTDERGRYMFADLPPGAYVVEVLRPPEAVHERPKHNSYYREIRLKGGESNWDVNFELRMEAARVVGRVVDQAGQPVAGARVEARHEPYWLGESGTPRTSSPVATTAEDGSFELAGLEPIRNFNVIRYIWGNPEGTTGFFRIKAEKQGYVPSQALVPMINAADAQDGMAIMKELEARGMGGTAQRPPDGFKAFPPNTGSAVGPIEFVLTEAGSISGLVVDTQGNFVGGSTVKLIDAEQEGEEPDKDQIKIGNDGYGFITGSMNAEPVIPETVTADAMGGFRVENVPPGRYVFDAANSMEMMQRARTEPVAINDGQLLADLRVVVDSPADRVTLTGLVVAADTGKAIAEASVHAPEIYGKKTNEHGGYRMTGIVPGEFDLSIEAEGYAPAKFTLSGRAGDKLEHRAELQPEGVLTGKVLVDGDEFHVDVSARNVDPTQGWHQQAKVTDGNVYRINKLKAGTYRISANIRTRGDGFQLRKSLTASVDYGQETVVDIAFDGTAAITGTFMSSDDQIICGVMVYEGTFTKEELEDWENVEPNFRASFHRIEAGQSYSIDPLPGGTYTVYARFRHKPEGLVVESQHPSLHVVTLGNGERIALDFAY